MKIEDTSGKEISTLEEWAELYNNPQQSHQWKQHRSAYSVAEFLLNHNGTEAIQARLSDVLGCDVQLDRAVPEYEVRFDKFGKGRMHDLGMFGHTEEGKSVFIGVEAKVDESFGASTLDQYLKAKAKQIVGGVTNAPQRIEDLLSLHFKKDDRSMFDVRYQLLYATVGTLAEEADIHILYVIVFKTLLYDESIGADNYRDYIQFMDKVGATSHTLPTKEAVGHKLTLDDKELVCLYEYFTL